MIVATEAGFYGGHYTYYRHHDGFRLRAELLRGFPEPVLVVGCGFGFLVTELCALGKDAWGIDASNWAINNCTNDRCWQADILNDENVDRLPPFATIATEDLLPCLTDTEAVAAAKNCSRIASLVLHFVTVQGAAPDLNYHPTDYWTNLTRQLTASLEGM